MHSYTTWLFIYNSDSITPVCFSYFFGWSSGRKHEFKLKNKEYIHILYFELMFTPWRWPKKAVETYWRNDIAVVNQQPSVVTVHLFV
jgi:hypothetical protein